MTARLVAAIQNQLFWHVGCVASAKAGLDYSSLVDESRAPWRNTTHDWTGVVDFDHLAHIRQNPAMFAPGGVQHLVLEVVAYAADEAECSHGGRCAVILHSDGSVSVSDGGRGTATRAGEHGRPVKKPAMPEGMHRPRARMPSARASGAPGARTLNPRIKSPLLYH